MDYLLIKLWMWVAAAGALGLVTGWLSCRHTDDDRR